MRPPEERFWAKVDKSGDCWIWTAATRGGYGQFRSEDKMVAAHRFAYESLVGPIPDGMQLDHACHVRPCVNPAHLRPVTNKQNHENRLGAQRNTSSGVRGVSWHKHTRKWRAEVGHNGERFSAGHFDDLAEAEAAVIKARNELFTHNDADRSVA